MASTAGKWPARFVWMAIIMGLFATAWTFFIAWPLGYLNSAWNISPAPSMIIAGGSAGTWLLLGYILLLVVGVMGTAMTSVFYAIMDSPNRLLSWLHLGLMSIGTAGATFLLMYAGYEGGGAMLSTAEGGLGYTAGQTHVAILQYYPEPIGLFVLIAIIGVLCGGLNYALTLRK